MALAEPVDACRETWLDAARAVLLESGVNAISISSLARQLGVSRGAFYWHFETRESLLSALLPIVSENAAPPVLNDLTCEAFETGFLALLDSVFLPDEGSHLAQRYRNALAQWAETDPEAQVAHSRLSAVRKRRLRAFLRGAGHSFSQARVRAYLLDRALFTSETGMLDRSSYATDLAELFRLVSGQSLSSAKLSRHLNRTLPSRLPTSSRQGAIYSLPQSAPPPP